MKPLLLFFLLPLQLVAQDITGIWTGYMQTTETKLSYELVITEGRNKLGGYSLTVFTFNGVENIGIKSMKLKNKKGTIAIEDDELLYNNFSSPPRKVKLLGELSLKTEGSRIILSGSFYTRSLDFRASSQNLFTGTIYLQKQDDYAQSKLISRLDEMNLLGSLPFVATKKKNEAPATAATEQFEMPSLKQRQNTIASAPPMAVKTSAGWQPRLKQVSLPAVIAIEIFELPSLKEKEKQLIATPRAMVKASPPVLQPAARAVPPPSIIYVTSTEPKPEPETPKKDIAAVQKKPPVNTEDSILNKQKTLITQTAPQPAATAPLTITAAQSSPVKAAVDFEKRKTEIIRSVPFTADSLVLSLYDNGTIDGDTVSVVLNGRVIIANKGLTANAIRTTIQITPDLGDSLQLVMYAENLGSIPPNTGLLIIQDGSVRNEIRFAGDLQKSSAIILRRKR